MARLKARDYRVSWRNRKSVVIPVLASVAVVVACLVVFSLLHGEGRDKALTSVVQGLLTGGVYALIALGVVVVFKSSRVFNLAHGGVLMFLSYLTWWLLDARGLPVAVALILLAFASVLVGLAIDRLLMRRMIGRGDLVTFLVTLVLGFSVIHGIAMVLWEGKTDTMPAIFPSGSLSVGDLPFTYTRVFAFVVATLMFLVFVSYFRYTKSGLAMRCVSEDHLVSQSLGINVKRIFTISWVVGCLSAAVGGVLLVSVRSGIDSEVGGFAIMMALPVILLGGMQSIPGAYVGAIIVGLTESVTAIYIDPHVPGFRTVLPYILMVAILIVRPHGIFGMKEVKRI